MCWTMKAVAHGGCGHSRLSSAKAPAAQTRGVALEPEGKYSVELFKEGGEGAGQEEIIDRHDNLTVARAIYRSRVSQISGPPSHAVRPRSHSGEERSTGDDAVKAPPHPRCETG